MLSASCFFVPWLLLILKIKALVRDDPAPAQQYTLGAGGRCRVPQLALFYLGLLLSSQSRAPLTGDFFSLFYFLFSIFWFRVPGDSFPDLLVGAQHRCALLQRSAAL